MNGILADQLMTFFNPVSACKCLCNCFLLFRLYWTTGMKSLKLTIYIQIITIKKGVLQEHYAAMYINSR